MAKQKTKEYILATMTRLVPGTISIVNCEKIEYCMDNKMRYCDDIKNLCVSSRDNEKIIGGISFMLGGKVGNGILIYRYGQEGYYANLFEGKGFDEIMEKVEKDENIKEIAERTKFIKDEVKEAECQNTIDAFKRYLEQPEEDNDCCILVTKKDNSGNYSRLDQELIKLAKEKEKSGKKIKIIDESELDKKVYVLGINSKELVKKLELEANTMMEADDRIHIFVFPASMRSESKIQDKYVGILTINSVEDDVIGNDDKKESLKKYFTEKYKGLAFISAEIFRKKK